MAKKSKMMAPHGEHKMPHTMASMKKKHSEMHKGMGKDTVSLAKGKSAPQKYYARKQNKK
jgi:hypothetical protein